MGLCTVNPFNIQMMDQLLRLAGWDSVSTRHGQMMELVKSRPLLVNLILHVRCVTQVQIDTSRFGVKCPDLIGNAGGQYMFFLYLFYRLCLSKVRPSVSNKSYLILSYLILIVKAWRSQPHYW